MVTICIMISTDICWLGILITKVTQDMPKIQTPLCINIWLLPIFSSFNSLERALVK